MLLLLQVDGPQHFDPPGFLTHSHTAMESASHHSNQSTTACFHGLAEVQPSKQENHTVPLSLNTTGGSLPSSNPGEQGKDCPENTGEETSLQFRSSGPQVAWQ